MPFFRQLVKGYLQSEDYDVTIVEDGQQALDLLAERCFDLLISDIEMPRVNGFELIQQVRANSQHKEMPAIALTSLNSDEDRAKALSLGFNRYQVKINREGILSAVADVLRRPLAGGHDGSPNEASIPTNTSSSQASGSLTELTNVST